MFKHAGPLKRHPQLGSTSQALFFGSAPSGVRPAAPSSFWVFAPFTSDSRLSLSVFTAPSTSSPLYIPYVFTLAFSGKPSRRAPRQYLCCGERSLHFFPAYPPPAFYHLNISPKQLIYSPGVVPSLFLFPLLHRPKLATPRLRIKAEDQETQRRTRKRLKMERGH